MQMNSTIRDRGAQTLPIASRRSNTAMERQTLRSPSFVQTLLHRALTHPLAIAAKRPLKDGWWAVRGAALSNPPLPARVESILFVCKGNICRSPFAAVRAAQLLAQSGTRGITCTSAGITATQAARPPQEACEAAAALDCPLDEHRPQQLTRDMIDGADMTIVMEAEQLIRLRQQYPDAIGRIYLLSLIDERANGYARYNIADPFGQEIEAVRSCYARIDGALKTLLSLLPAAPAVAATTVSGTQDPRR
jgi:protein-tyrosine-phosphatase